MDGINRNRQLSHLALRFDSWFYPKDGKVDPGGGGGAVVNWTGWAKLQAIETREQITHANGRQTKKSAACAFASARSDAIMHDYACTKCGDFKRMADS